MKWINFLFIISCMLLVSNDSVFATVTSEKSSTLVFCEFISKLNNPSLIISCLALAFTLFSFWWMNWRKGQLIVGPPRSYAACSNGPNSLIILQLPLVFYNDGAATQVVQNLRLSLEQKNNKSKILHFNNTLSDLASDSNKKWARQFAIGGRKSYSSIFVFQRKAGNFVFAPEKCKAILEAKIDKGNRWQVLLTFEIQTPANKINILNSNTLIAYDNDPDRQEK